MMLRNITKIFVRIASVALIAAMVQVSLISLPSAQTISAQTPLEAQILIKKIDELKNSGRYAEAIPLQQRLLALTEMVLGPNHPDVATALGNLADALRKSGSLCRSRAALQAVAGDHTRKRLVPIIPTSRRR